MTDRDIVIAVDAGHGGEDPGASGRGGTHEKDVVLAIARALAARINHEPGMRAVLTRDGDYLIQLRDRMTRAHAAGADMFVSIHADAVRDREVSGASVYTLSEHGASSEAARQLADQENAADLKGGVSLADKSPALASVLLDVSQNANIGASVEAAGAVLNALDRVGAVRKREVQQAGFMVLKSPDIPSMLVETAYISNPSEEAKLRTGSQQQRLAAAIFTGVAAYFHKYPPEGSVFARQRGAGVDATASAAGAADESSAGADPLAVTGISGISGMSGMSGAPGALNIARNQP
jgi:N-acetylmuramoyl-L-alanine amidase